MESSQEDPGVDRGKGRAAAVRRAISSEALRDALLFAATVNLLSIPLAGGISFSLVVFSLTSPSLGWSLGIFVAAVALRFGPEHTTAERRADAAGWIGAHRFSLALGLLTLVGLLLRLKGIGFGMPLLVHEDEAAVVGVAIRQFQSGWIDPVWYVYPTFFINLMMPALAIYYVYARGHGLVGDIEQIPLTTPGFYLVSRYHSAVLGTVTIPLTYWLAEKLLGTDRGRRAGLIAAAVVTFSFIHVRESHFGVTDVPTAAVATAALIAIANVFHSGTTRQYLAAGFLCGLAASTKYTVAAIVLSFLAAHFLGRKPSDWAARPFGAGLAAIPAGFLFGSPYALLNWKPFLQDLGWLSAFAGTPDPVNAQANFAGIAGYAAESGFGLPVFVCFVLAALLAMYRRRRGELVLLAFVLGSIPYMSQSTHPFYPRFLVPLVPPIAVLVGGFVVDAIDWLRARQVMSRRAATAAFLAAIVMLPWPAARESVIWVRIMSRPDSRVSAYSWIRERFPEGAVIASEVWFNGMAPEYAVLDWPAPLSGISIDELVSANVDVVAFRTSFDQRVRGGPDENARRALKIALGTPTRFGGPEQGIPGPPMEVYVVSR
jgi:hypothetical protein